jgi:hypothetical protein
MGLSFKIHKRLLQEQVSIYDTLEEVFDAKPFKTTFMFIKDEDDVYVPRFNDPKGNAINIHFYHEGNNLYTLDFMVNDNSYKSNTTKYTLLDYTTLLSTIAQAVSQFLEKCNPVGLVLTGTNVFEKIANKPQAEGQKDRIYKYFISQIEDQGNYMVDKSVRDGIALMRKYKQD